MLEKRLHRKAFTKKLIKICTRLDALPVQRVEHNSDWRGWVSADVWVENVWVCGSYARGALSCGDLDLVVDFRHENGYQQPIKKMKVAFFGSPRRVSVFSGTPQCNSSGIEFPEAVLIWTRKSDIWRDAIDSIAIDTAAGRAARMTDIIPLRQDQWASDPDKLKHVASLIEEGVLESHFVPFESMKDELDSLTGKDSERFRLVVNLSGVSKVNRKLLGNIYRLAKDMEPDGFWCFEHSSTYLKHGNTHFRIGIPQFTPDFFTRAILHAVMIPSPNQRGPNGAWVVSRGPNHPDVLALGSQSYFTVFSGKHPFFKKIQTRQHFDLVLQLFTDKEEAEKYLVSVKSKVDEGAVVKEIQGQELLQAACKAFTIRIGRKKLRVQDNESFFIRVTPSQLVDFLR